MNTPNKIDDIIQQLVDEKTLSTEAFQHIYQIKAEHEKLLAEVEANRLAHNDQVAELTKELNGLRPIKSLEEGLETRNRELKKERAEFDKEKALTEHSLKCEKEKVALVQRMVEVVFANNLVKRHIYGNNGNGSFSKDETEDLQ